MGVAKRPYDPSPLGDDAAPKEIIAYIQRELDNIAKTMITLLSNPLDEIHSAPSKVFTGLTVLADGTDWNPGAGQGVYTYYAAAWHKLG